MRPRVTVLSILMGLLLAACGTVSVGIELTPTGSTAATNTPPPATNTPAPTGAPTLAPTATSGAVKTYRNLEVGFELDYPADWILEETGIDLETSAGVVAYLYSRAPEPTPGKTGSEGVPPDLVKIDINVMPFSARTLDQVVAEQKASILSAPNGAILSEERLTLAGGLEAHRLHAVSLGEAASLLAVINGYPVIIAGYGDLSGLDPVARSLRAINVQAGPRSFTCSLAYADGGRLYCLAEGGTPVPIAEAPGGALLSRPDISQDGRWVAYLIDYVDGTGELWAVDVSALSGNDGLQLPRRRLVASDQIGLGGEVINAPLDYQWQADTHTLYFNTRYTQPGGNPGPGEYVNNDLWRVDVDSGKVTNLLGRDNAGQFLLSPDGQYVAFGNPQAVGLARADGSDFRLLVEFPPVITYSEYQFKPRIVWGPASDTFAALIPSADPLAADASGTIYHFGVDGSVREQATLPGSFLFGADLDSFGTMLAYQTHDPASGITSLHFVNADGSGDTVVAQNASLNGLGWALYGPYYAYTLSVVGENYVVSADGRTLQFGDGVQAVEVRWVGPESLYFLGARGGEWGLYFYALGQPTVPLVTGLGSIPTFDVRP